VILYETKIEVMDWMIRYQLGQRNLSPVQRITVVKKYESKMKEEAQERKGIRTDLIKNENSTLSPIGHNVDTFGRTKEKLAKLANVGTGTIARFNVVMNSDDEKIKEKMLKDEITIAKPNSSTVNLPQSSTERNPTTSEKLATIAGFNIVTTNSDYLS